MGKTKKAQQKETINITHILLGVGLLALTIYTGWIIIQAPDSTGYDTIAAYSADLQKKMGFLGGLIYLLMHGLMGKGIVLFPFLLCLSGLSLLSGKQLSQMQMTGGVMAGLIVLTVLHMNITYVDIKDDFLLGMSGNGGGVIGAALSLLLQKALGNVGAYIALFCLSVIAVIIIAQGAVLNRGEDFISAVKQTWSRIKETVSHFIFVDEEELFEEEIVQPSALPKNSQPTMKEKKQVKAEAVSSSGEERRGKKRNRLKSFFVEEVPQAAESSERRTRYTGTEYVVIPKEKPVILSSLVEIHKTLDEQEPRKGLSPTEPLKPYGIQDSVEDFQQVMRKRQEKQNDEQEEQQDQREEQPLTRSKKVTAKSKEQLKQESDTKIAEEDGKDDDVQAVEFVPEEMEEGVYQYPSIDLLEENPASGSNKN